MSRLFRYTARQYAAHLGLVLLALVVLVLGVTLIENAGALARDANGPAAAWSLCRWSMSEYAYQNWPIAALIAALSCSATSSGAGETLAIMATGQAPWRLALPYIFVATCGAGIMGLGAEVVLPQSLARKLSTLEHFRARDAATSFFNRRNPWLLEGNRLLFVPQVDIASATFASPSVYTLRDGRIVAVTTAASLSYDGARGGWHLKDAEEHRIDSAQVSRDADMPLPLRLQPSDLIETTGNPRMLGMAQLTSLVARRERAGFDTHAHRLELHSRFAQPIAGLALLLVVLPWVVDPDRRRSLTRTLGGGVVLIAAFLSWSQLCRLWAMSHIIAASTGAWGGIAACLCALPLAPWAHRRFIT